MGGRIRAKFQLAFGSEIVHFFLSSLKARGIVPRKETQLNAGNLVKIEGGCATVTGYKLPHATVPHVRDGKAEARFEAPSQDTGSSVLVVMERFSINFSVKEKDEASPLNCFQLALNDLHSPLRSMEVFCFYGKRSPAPPGLESVSEFR
jgi:hypothetical protein